MSYSSEKNIKRHKCTVKGCKARFARPSKLEVHLRKHTGERPYKCDACDKTYTNDSHLRRHKKTTHSDTPKKTYRCPYEGCYRNLANKQSYKKHINNCHKHKYKCNECTEYFRKKYQLHVHMYIHSGVPPFTCESCKIGFNSKILYTKHKRNHKTYVCECSMTFDRWSVLLKHRNNCEKCKKYYDCNICQKRFNTRAQWKRHKTSHIDNGVKFKCTFENCERAYKYKNNLQFHIKRFHLKEEGKKLKCTYPGCKKILSRQQTLDNHIKLHMRASAENLKKTVRKVRKDKGLPKKSMALRLAGLEAPFEAEKIIMNGEDVLLEFDEISEDYEEESDILTESDSDSDSDCNLEENVAIADVKK